MFCLFFSNDSELKKAAKKAAEKEARFKERQQEQKDSKDTAAQSTCGDEKTLDSKVRFRFIFFPASLLPFSLQNCSAPQAISGKLH